MPRSERPSRGRPRPPAAAADPRQEDSPGSPRIVGGSLRGRRLPAPGSHTRPMKDRVRESLFNLLGTDVVGAVAIDPFAGTGALGFEAISRGAREAWFGERHFPTADALRRTADALGVADKAVIRPGDALLWARRMPPLPATAPWVVFVSPPWELFASRTADLMALVAAFVAAAPPGSRIVVEADEGFDPGALPDAAAWESRPMPPAALFLRSTASPA